MDQHEKWMRLAIEQAKLGKGLTSPNPTVGAVIVKNDELIGKGYHPKAGALHAERMAIADAVKNSNQEKLKGSTIYVTLEPCSTTGKTPPCTSGILEAGITEVVYGCDDPNPSHAGAAKEVLEKHNISVSSGILDTECKELIRDFAKRIASQWLTSSESRDIVHRIRSEVDAIIIGGRTLRKDNPKLTIRGKYFNPEKSQPFRAVITHSGRSELPKNLHVFTDEHKDKTIIYQDIKFEKILTDLANRGCNSVLLECGGGLMGQWFDQSLVDECYVFLAPLITGGGDLAVAGKGVESNQSSIQLNQVTYQRIKDDVLAHGFI